jgi:ParB-like chromosome segregation protein Spo0J
MTQTAAGPRARRAGAALRIEYAAPSSLRVFEQNPRKITRTARERLKRGIQAFGLVEPIVARRQDRRVLGGHQRLEVARELKLKTIPIVFLDGITDPRAKALVVLLNNPAAQGEWDLQKLGTLVRELDSLDAPLTGFDPAELKAFGWLDPASGGEADPVADPGSQLDRWRWAT